MSTVLTPSGRGQPPSHIRKAFYAFSQYEDLIARIMFSVPRIRRAYYGLIGVGTLTIAFAVVFSVAAAHTGAGYVRLGAPVVVGVLFTFLFPAYVAVLGVLSGISASAIVVYTSMLPVATVVTGGSVVLGITVLNTGVLAAFLTWHAVHIGAQVWDEMSELNAPTDDTPNTTDAAGTRQ